MIQAVSQCQHVYRVQRTTTRGNRRVQYAYCTKCGHARKNVIVIPVTEFRVHFWIGSKYAV